MNLRDFHKMTTHLGNTGKMPVLFLGHGSPMNAIEDNEFVKGFRNLGEELERPHAILCVSAHWETKGTYVTAMDHPQTIHDFGGFPQALYDVQYPAPGSPELAKTTKDLITKTEVGLDYQWGLDHGSWSVVKHLYPIADVPIIQMSLDYTKPPLYHYELALELAALRNKGILIVGSGNMVHNLRMVAWDKVNGEPYGYDWAIEANEKMKAFILENNHSSLIDFRSQGKAFDLAIPTPEHYLPLLYAIALKEKNEDVSFFNDAPLGGSLSMTSLKIH
ncbi:4,5-DOPA dioxygenase extradiol [Maribacter algicola]|uniref:4,5-DOPA dioxygenase extradiol n=1 Tax=Maribacter algicola TaxID=2498892 RepID=A0A3R8RZU8_9FLAO|nr:4,5-DOPA dioxygenase extradiol [Maribacter algicola]RRQ48923.1 4,5-DOPA dioxygenase extradiol [Maribacter algicola]